MYLPSQEKNKVTLLHKGLGPRLFQYQSKPNPVYEVDRRTPRSADRPPRPPPKRIIVKCVEGLGANSTFTRRVQERNPNYRGAVNCCPSSSSNSKLLIQPRTSKERLASRREPRKHQLFPPLNFMPRWHSRKMDRTYLDRMVLEDPWSLPPEKKDELQRRTGLRLQSISRYYQFKVGRNLPYGQDAMRKCNCHVNFCDHCTKSYSTYRCPLHMQLLDPVERDCKTEEGRFCLYSKQPESMPLDKIQDVSIYISEVVRRLKAGEINEVPPFPDRFPLLSPEMERMLKAKAENDSNLPTETISAMEIAKKVVVENTYTQTEPFAVDVDFKGAAKDNLTQTLRQEKEEPMMLSVLKSMENQLHFKRQPVYDEVSTQVSPLDIGSFQEHAGKLVENLAKTVVTQALREVDDDIHLLQVKKETARLEEQFQIVERTREFIMFQENFRYHGYIQEGLAYEDEMREERDAESIIGAITFCQNMVSKIPRRVMAELRDQGFVSNEDLKAIQSAYKNHLNERAENNLKFRETSRKLLADMMYHAAMDIEIGSYHQPLPIPVSPPESHLPGTMSTSTVLTETESGTAREDRGSAVSSAEAGRNSINNHVSPPLSEVPPVHESSVQVVVKKSFRDEEDE